MPQNSPPKPNIVLFWQREQPELARLLGADNRPDRDPRSTTAKVNKAKLKVVGLLPIRIGANFGQSNSYWPQANTVHENDGSNLLLTLQIFRVKNSYDFRWELRFCQRTYRGVFLRLKPVMNISGHDGSIAQFETGSAFRTLDQLRSEESPCFVVSGFGIYNISKTCIDSIEKLDTIAIIKQPSDLTVRMWRRIFIRPIALSIDLMVGSCRPFHGLPRPV